jgi:pullulanase/glycogen debranching enzyme
MYKQFGGLVDQTAKTVTFKLFVPDGERAPSQYEGGGLPRLTGVFVVGSFQTPPWNPAAPIPMTRTDYRESPTDPVIGWVYSFTSDVLLDGFYEYKYLLNFEDADPVEITDPCGRYGGSVNQNSGFVVGGSVEDVKPIDTRLPYGDLIIYELMIDDFTAKIKRDNEAPLQTIVRKLDDLVSLGINAIEFMPWTAWTYPDDPATDFSWGYNPVQYFSVAHKYTLNPTTETDKLVYLKRLINECHARGIHVIMDGVFNHADATPPDRGFPYYWLYQDPADSPYVGNFAQAAFFKDLDYANQCTLEYIRDACFYWIDTFRIDGIRLDNTLGYYKPDDRGHGLPKLLSELRGHYSKKKIKNFATILEHSWDYAAIDVVNKVGSTSCWLDPYRSQSMDYIGNRPAGIPQVEQGIMRMLDSGRDFALDHVPTIYIENHDHKRFMLKAGGRGSWFLTQPYIIALFTSPGATLIYNGQEYGAQNDMPESGDGRVVPRPLDWTWLQQDPGPKVFARYQAMMTLRKNNPALQTGNFYPSNWDESHTQLDPDGYGIDRDRNIVVYHRWGDAPGGKTDKYYVVLNFSQSDQQVSFAAPDGSWKELINGAIVHTSNGRISDTVSSNWGAIYYQRL